MASFPACYKIVMITTLATILLLVVSSISSSAHPIEGNKDFPPGAFEIVRENMKDAIEKETRMGASILRLHFHDCFVNGCDASILLDDTPTFTGEKTAGPNNNSARGFKIIDNIKSALEKAKFHVSCADILAVAARDAVVLLGGDEYNYNVPVGRKDSFDASLTDANKGIPGPNSTIKQLIKRFKDLGLRTTELVALSGAHTIGQARCTTFRARIYNNNSVIDPTFASGRQSKCPSTAGQGDDNLANLDVQTAKTFDNNYFKNLVNKKGLLNSDQQLYNGGKDESSNIVKQYAENQDLFKGDFGKAMIRMGNIKILKGKNGEIRRNCRKRN